MTDSSNSVKYGRLNEVKAGKTGYGLLIESDGYVSRDLTENNRRLIKEAFDSRVNGEWNIPNPFVLDVILQKYGIENANKRIYPEEVLKREVAKYQKLIDERMALGECYKPDAEVLTSEGWRSLQDIAVGDEVLTFGVENGEVVFKPCAVEKKINKKSTSQLVTIKSGGGFSRDEYGINDSVTPGHRYPVFKKEGEKFVYFCDVEARGLKKYKDCYIPVAQNIFTESGGDTVGTNFALIGGLEFAKEDYSGKVMCIEVHTHNFYVRCGGKTHWTCNCNHPEHTEIDLGRVSHNIVECHWEGHTLVGKIEFNVTEGFRRYGICSSLGDTCVNLIMNGYKIGVSSRGVGSVEQRLGKLFVDSSFDLIAFDVVATPSTSNAFIGSYDYLKQFVENDKTHENSLQLSEKIEKVKKLL